MIDGSVSMVEVRASALTFAMLDRSFNKRERKE